MKIVRIPEGFPQEQMQILANKLKEERPNEHFVFISDAIEVLDLPLRELYKLREEIDKEISECEMMRPDERNKS